MSALRDVLRAATSRMRTSTPQRHAFHYERVLGTSFELQVVASDFAAARQAEEVVLAEVDRLSTILSGYSATSELSRWTSHVGVLTPVSPALADVLLAAELWRVRTDGAFNPAASSLIELLRDEPPVEGTASLDASSRARALRARLDAMRQPLWTVNRATGLVCRLTDLPVSLDAIAK